MPQTLTMDWLVPQKKADAELARAREAEKAARSYDNLFSEEDDDDHPKQSVQEMMDDFM